jgi:hypothetical protein
MARETTRFFRESQYQKAGFFMRGRSEFSGEKPGRLEGVPLEPSSEGYGE